jgi:hypothetical protein
MQFDKYSYFGVGSDKISINFPLFRKKIFNGMTKHDVIKLN